MSCFYKNKQDRPCKIILGFPKTFYYINSYISAIFNIFKKFKIANKIKYFIFNNTNNNNTTINIISIKLSFNKRFYKKRYISYILNLLAKSLFFSKLKNKAFK